MSRRTDWDPHDRQDHAGFWVHPDECVYCGVCHPEAPGIFVWRNAHDRDKVSELARQPESQDEVYGVINAMDVCCCECIFYGGRDPKIISRLQGMDLRKDCIIHG